MPARSSSASESGRLLGATVARQLRRESNSPRRRHRLPVPRPSRRSRGPRVSGIAPRYPHRRPFRSVNDDAAKALQFDEESVKTIITNLSSLRGKLPEAIKATLAHFEGVDRNIEGFEGLEKAQNAIKDDKKKDAFAKDYKYLSRLWESLSPDRMLDIYQKDYKWLSQVFESVRPPGDNLGKLLWIALGAQTN